MKIKLILIIFICLSLTFCASYQKKLQNQRENDPRYQYNMGLFYLQNNNIDKAIWHLNKSISINPRYDVALCSLGLAYSMKGELIKAEKYYKKTLQVNPALIEVHNYLGIIYHELGYLDKAEQEFITAISDDNYKSKHLPYFNLAKLRFEQGNLEQALSFVNKSISRNSNMVMSHNLRGIIQEKLGNYNQAITSYQSALDIIKNDVTIQFNLAVAYFKNKQYSEAKKIFLDIRERIEDPQKREQINKYLEIIG
ncbi:MAG: tetratricopeptide repeat protein [Candidatus Aminicenantaceae bacterium]